MKRAVWERAVRSLITGPPSFRSFFKVRLSLLVLTRAILQPCQCLALYLTDLDLYRDPYTYLGPGTDWPDDLLLVVGWSWLPAPDLLCSSCSGAVDLCPCRWGHCPACHPRLLALHPFWSSPLLLLPDSLAQKDLQVWRLRSEDTDHNQHLLEHLLLIKMLLSLSSCYYLEK